MMEAYSTLDKNLQDIAFTFSDGFHFMPRILDAPTLIKARQADPTITTNLPTDAALMKMVGQFAEICSVSRKV